MNKVDTAELFLACIKSAVFNDGCSKFNFDSVSDNEWKQVYSLSSKHDLSHIVSDFIFSSNISLDDKVKSAFNKKMVFALKNYTMQEYELQCIREAFEKNGITFIVLKGEHIRKLYPKEWMRASCDIDILVDSKSLEKAQNILKNDFHYSERECGFHDVLMVAPSGVNVELHFSILEDRSNIDLLLQRAWEYSLPKDNSANERVFTPEFQIFHVISHLYYHFLSGGCGVKPFIDIKLILENTVFDSNRLKEMLEIAQIDVFFEKVVLLSNIWFGEREHEEMTLEVADYVLRGNVYGTIENKILAEQAVQGRTKNFLNRIFMPYDSLRILYPNIKKWQTPFFQIVRIIEKIKNRTAVIGIQELKLRVRTNRSDIDNVQKIIKFLGI